MKNAKKRVTVAVLSAGVLLTSGIVLGDMDLGQQIRDWVQNELVGREQVIKDKYYDDAVVETAKLTGEAETAKQGVATGIEDKASQEKETAVRTLSDLVKKYEGQLTAATTEELAAMNAVFNKFVQNNKGDIDEVVTILRDGNKALADKQLGDKKEEVIGEVKAGIKEHQTTLSTELEGKINTSKTQLLDSMNKEQEAAQGAIHEHLTTEFDKAVTEVKNHIEGKSEGFKTEIGNVANEAQEEAIGEIDEMLTNAFAVSDSEH